MSNPGRKDDDDVGGATVILHHRGSGRYASLSNSDYDHIRSSVSDDGVKAKLAALAESGDS